MEAAESTRVEPKFKDGTKSHEGIRVTFTNKGGYTATIDVCSLNFINAGKTTRFIWAPIDLIKIDDLPIGTGTDQYRLELKETWTDGKPTYTYLGGTIVDALHAALSVPLRT